MRWFALFVLVFCCTVALRVWSEPVARNGTESAVTRRDAIAASTDSDSSNSVVVVSLVVSPSCAACNDPALLSSIRELQRAVNLTPEGRVRFAGIALARSSADGVQFLERFGSFDEVMAGSGWDGVIGRRYLQGDGSGVQAVPQLIVSELVDEIDHPLGRRKSTERLVQRRVGLDAILHFTRTCASDACLRR